MITPKERALHLRFSGTNSNYQKPPLFAYNLPRNASKLKIRPKEKNVLLQGDVGLLESAILNLVINARGAVGTAPSEINLFMRADKSSELVHIFVSDNGPGMDDGLMAQAVEPFFTTKAVSQGSGLGLSMVNGFAEQSSGK